ncbi:MAG: oxidoreductase [Acidimicrobiales bacterium]
MSSKSEWTMPDVPDQTGKRFVITGANSGIGLETARTLAQRGAHVVLACRNQESGQRVLGEIRDTVPGASVELVSLDLASLASVRACAEALNAAGNPIDVLINNAGIMAVPRGVTKDGFELQLGTNHLGHFALTGLLLDRILASEQPRVVTVSSNAHKAGRIRFDDLQSERKYSRFSAYAQSKLANLLFTMELQRRFRRVGLDDALALASHPGWAMTNLSQGMSDGLWAHAVKVTDRAGTLLGQPATGGALPTLRAATDPTAKGGDYFGPARLAESKGPAVKVSARPRAYDVHDARGLWEQSVSLTGVTYERLTA